MSDGPPPPPPPHGANPKTTAGGGLPGGRYDIFVIPEHSAGAGFLYLPSLQPNVNSFVAGFASALACVVVFQSMAPALQQWWSTFQGLGNLGISLLMLAIGLGAWALGRQQGDTGKGASGQGHSRHNSEERRGPFTSGASGTFGGGPGSYSSSSPPPPPHSGSPPHQHAPPPQSGPPPNQHRHAPSPSPSPPPKSGPPPTHHPPPPPSPPPEPDPPKPEPNPPRSEPPKPEPPKAAPPKPEPPKPEPPKPEPPKPAPAPEVKKPAPQPEAKKPEAAQNAWQKAREETRKREEERKAKEAEQKRREEAARRLRELREKEAREREEREKTKREKEQKEKDAREREAKEKEKLLQETRIREQREKDLRERLEKERQLREKIEKEAKQIREEKERLERERKEREEKLRKEKEADKEGEGIRKGSSYAYSSVGEKMSMWPNGRPPSPTKPPPSPSSAPPRPAPSTTSTSTPRPASPAAKRPPAPTARSTTGTSATGTSRTGGTSTTGTERESEYSYRPYDKPKRPTHKKSVSDFSETSWAPSQSTARTTPPPSMREPYSTQDPDKIVIKAVYCYVNQFAKTPASQLISGLGTVTDGLILRITTEGLFIDDDVRGVAQREWDVKTWTLKLLEVWCPTHSVSAAAQAATAPAPPANHTFFKTMPGRRAAGPDRGAPKTLTGDEADAYLVDMLKACKDTCRQGNTPPRPTAGAEGSLHLLRATVRDQEGKRYLFVVPEEDGWKVALGLQRLRRGTQVRALGVSTFSQLEARNVTETLGW